jgi:hypothetical protein
MEIKYHELKNKSRKKQKCMSLKELLGACPWSKKPRGQSCRNICLKKLLGVLAEVKSTARGRRFYLRHPSSTLSGIHFYYHREEEIAAYPNRLSDLSGIYFYSLWEITIAAKRKARGWRDHLRDSPPKEMNE